MKPGREFALKVITPSLLGIAVVAWLFAREFSIEAFRMIPWNGRALAGLALALAALAGREAGLMWRYRALTDRALSRVQAFRTTIMVEFTSAITPGTAGGGILGMVFMTREGISLGRATVLTVTTLFLDEMFFVVIVPLLFIVVPGSEIFGFAPGTVGAGIRISFWIVYGFVCAVTILLFCGIFISPGAIGTLLVRATGLRLLSRFRRDAEGARKAMIETGSDLRQRPLRWWVEPVVSTILTWSSRYLVVNALFWGFSTGVSQGVVFARQAVVWTLLTVSPTPGGSGLSEWLFTTYYGDLLSQASTVLVIAVIWRLLTYYVYLVAGALTVPSWIKGGKPLSRSLHKGGDWF